MATQITVPSGLDAALKDAAKEARLVWASYPNGERGRETDWRSRVRSVRALAESFAASHGLTISAVAGNPHCAGRITLS